MTIWYGIYKLQLIYKVLTAEIKKTDTVKMKIVLLVTGYSLLLINSYKKHIS